ncbi:PREDICTED: uncharacterized protein LOC104758932 [Camelina sativa]|uniref:Uncharacterized protein LOC104758932 n=1 Tax=Camelina sativa TaxID=90675 RepID=A0ABM0X3V5_CAMSA|nr:PREDICTED: uncharacterized protein LOC104758932 [Camelina sativa]
MPTGDCFHCHQPGHWANNCPFKTTTEPASSASPPVIHCPCNGGPCNIFTSKTGKNPNRRFYKCPIPSCGFFKWCDEVSIIKPESISVHPTCACGAGPCTRVTFIDGPNAQRSYFVCCLKKNFGACGFFQWEDDFQTQPQPQPEQVGNDGSPCPTLIGHSGFDSVDDVSLLLHETSLDSNGNVKRSRLGVVVETDLNPSSSNESTLGNRVVGRTAQPLKDNLLMNAVPMGKESIPVFAGFNNRKPVYNGVSASADGRNRGTVPSFDLITLCEDAVHLETDEQVLPSLAPTHVDPQVESLRSGLFGFNCKSSYASEDKTGVCQNTSDSVSNGKTNPNHKHQPEHQSYETGASFSGSFSLMDLIEQYNSEKLHFKSVSLKYVDALTAFTGSYKQLESLRDRAHSLKKELRDVEKQVKFCEAETSEFAMSLREVSGEMVKLQKKMVEKKDGRESG